MATVNKNFKIKQGLVVEGSTATVGGNNVLVENTNASDQYIIDLIGGETLVTSVESTQMEVIAGELNIKSGVFDVSGAAAAAQAAAEATASADATSKANAAQAAAEATASADATSKANAAQAAAEQHADTAVANLVNGAPELLDTLNELASALQDNPDVISDLQGIAAGKQDSLTPGANIDITSNTISVTGLDTADVTEDASNLYFTDARAKTSAADLLTGASLTNITITGSGAGLTITAENGVADSDTDDLAEGTTNLYFTNQRALTATAAAYDAAGAAAAAQAAAEADATSKANAAQSAAASDATSKANAAQAAAEATAASDATSKANAAQAAAEATASADATSKANAAQAAAEATASADATSKANAAQAAAEATASADATSKANAAQAAAEATASADATSKANAALALANTYTDGAVAGLVDSAPELLNTLNELAAALGNSPDTISNLTTLVGTKADTSYVDAEISDLDTAAQGYASAAQTAAEATASADATSKANAAQAAAEATASADATSKANAAQAAAEATASADATSKANAAQAAAEATLDDVLDGTTAFTEINVNSEAKQIAATSSSLGSVVVTAYSWPKAEYRSAKLIVKIDNATDNEVSEILLTLDSADNIAITEYAIVGTNGSRGSITARVSGANVEVRVDPVNDSTIKVSGTLLK